MHKYSLFIVLLSLFLFSCQQKNTEEKTEAETLQAPDMHQSRNSLDWAGHYFGLLPCADCEGIQTHLELRENGQFFRSNRYLGKGAEIFRDSGQFIWDARGSVVLLRNADGTEGQAYQVGENVLLQLDASGKTIEGALAEHYRLYWWDARLWQTEWKLHSLETQALEEPNQDERPIMRFDLAQMQVLGTGGCNRYSGGFVAEGADRLRFLSLASTRMACPEMETEARFMQALEKVAFFRLDAEGLSFFDEESQELLYFNAEGSSEQ